MTPLRAKMIYDMELRRFSPNTQEAYIQTIQGIAKYYKQSPDQLSQKQVHDYLHYLMVQKKLSWSTCNVAASAFKFFYNITLGLSAMEFNIPARKTPKQLPEILSAKELECLFSSVHYLKGRTLLMTIYAAGLRASEAVRLKVSDIDSNRMMIRVEQGKGSKDRYTILSKRLLLQLRDYWRIYRPDQWLFYGRHRQEPLGYRSAQKIFQRAKKTAGISKKGGIHSLRHAFATHLMEIGVDLRTVQLFLGHSSIQSTSVYLHLTQKKLDSIQSPFDLLDLPSDLNRLEEYHGA